jgi:hypothetical protein
LGGWEYECSKECLSSFAVEIGEGMVNPVFHDECMGSVFFSGFSWQSGIFYSRVCPVFPIFFGLHVGLRGEGCPEEADKDSWIYFVCFDACFCDGPCFERVNKFHGHSLVFEAVIDMVPATAGFQVDGKTTGDPVYQ